MTRVSMFTWVCPFFHVSGVFFPFLEHFISILLLSKGSSTCIYSRHWSSGWGQDISYICLEVNATSKVVLGLIVKAKYWEEVRSGTGEMYYWNVRTDKVHSRHTEMSNWYITNLFPLNLNVGPMGAPYMHGAKIITYRLHGTDYECIFIFNW